MRAFLLVMCLVAATPSMPVVAAAAGDRAPRAYDYDAVPLATAVADTRISAFRGYDHSRDVWPARQRARPLSRATKAVRSVDDVLSDATVVRRKFASSADPGAVLVRRDPVTGAPTHYQVYGPDGFPVKRVDLTGREHGGVPTPHVVEFQRNVNPNTGEVFVRPNRSVRPANPDEVPGG